MRSLRYALVTAALVAGFAQASPQNPVEGKEYTVLAAPQPTQAVGKKVEVIEFFAYHCGACNAFEPTLNSWAQKHGDKIVMRRIPLPFMGASDPEARLFLTLDAMGVLDQYHHRVFRAVHVERKRLDSDDAIVSWATSSGLDRTKFLAAWNSFGVTTKLKRLQATAENYKVSSTPSLVVDGKYVLSPSTVMNANNLKDAGQVMSATAQTLDALVAKAAKTK